MKKWITEKINMDEFWLSYYPSIFTLALNSVIMASNLVYPVKSRWLNCFLIFILSFGIAWSLRGLYVCYCFRKERAEYRSSMEKFMMSLNPEIERIMAEEWNVEERDEEESMRVAQARICELIQSESDRRKIGLTVSNSDTP